MKGSKVPLSLYAYDVAHDSEMMSFYAQSLAYSRHDKFDHIAWHQTTSCLQIPSGDATSSGARVQACLIFDMPEPLRAL